MSQSMIGTKSMVVSPHYLASAAGCRILQKGGNAFDAAVAVSACLAVVYPHMTGIGEILFGCFTVKRIKQFVRITAAAGQAITPRLKNTKVYPPFRIEAFKVLSPCREWLTVGMPS